MPASSNVKKATFGFGSSTSRFDVRGVGHPNSKAPGTCLSATYNPNPIQPFAQHSLGPGSHNMPLNHTQDQAEYRTTTDDRDFWTKDPSPRMKRPNRDQALTPGPGTYGKDGVPAARFDRTVDKSQPLYSSPTKLGIMDAEGRKERKRRGKDGVAPGQYHHEQPVVRSATGSKGPYELMTGERFNLNKKKDASLGPGQYPIKSIAAKQEHLNFSKDGKRFPNVPGDLFTNASLAHYPRDVTQPKPTNYNPDKNGIGTGKRMSTKAAPFDRSASRADQRECYKTKTFNGNMFANSGHSQAPNQYMQQRDWTRGEQGDGSSGVKTAGTAKYTRTYKASVDSNVSRMGAMQGGR